jgi:hypothetical protein
VADSGNWSDVGMCSVENLVCFLAGWAGVSVGMIRMSVVA